MELCQRRYVVVFESVRLILLFVVFVELVGTVYASFLFMRIIFVVYAYVYELVSEKPTRGMI
jgi:hypothetical protein